MRISDWSSDVCSSDLSSLLKPAAAVLEQALAGIELAPAQIPLINNVDVQTPSEPGVIKDALVRQAWHPVRWVETLQAMKAQGITHVVECGPGKVLAGLTKRIDKDLEIGRASCRERVCQYV